MSNNDVQILQNGELPPAFYCYGTRDPFYDQFLANADAVEEAGVRVERLQLDGRLHGFGYRENWFDDYDNFLTDVFSDKGGNAMNKKIVTAGRLLENPAYDRCMPDL